MRDVYTHVIILCLTQNLQTTIINHYANLSQSHDVDKESCKETIA